MSENLKNDNWNAQNVDEELNKQLLKHFKGEKTGFVQVGPKKYFFPKKFAQDGKKYYNFKPRPTDTWVVTFPRSGTTWTQEMVWLISNNLNFTKAYKTSLLKRFPFLEFSSCVHEDIYKELLDNAETKEMKEDITEACSSVLETLEEMTEPRFIKSHLPFSLLPPDLLTCGAKVIYVARNPRDVVVSYFNFHHLFITLDYEGEFETFWNFFKNNLELWTPYWDHILEAWAHRNNPNLLFLFYEDLKKELRSNISKVAEFLGKQYSVDDINKLIYNLNFERFQNNPSVNMEELRDLGFFKRNDQRCIRQGKVGGWKDLFVANELQDEAKKWIQENVEKTDIKLPDSWL